MSSRAHTVCAGGKRAASRRPRGAGLAFPAICALLFVASVAATLAASASMSSMGELPMPGGWSMSTMWTRMCGQTWPRAAASFVGTWTVMTAAMMLPSLVPMLSRYREAVGMGMRERRLALLTLLVGVGYFVVWAALGVAVFALGAALATAELQWQTFARAVPATAGLVVLLAGALQFSKWKMHHLICCRATPELAADAGTAWRYGLCIGIRCGCCCAGLTAMLLVIGMMDLRMMALVTAAITGERVAPDGARFAQVVGVFAIGGGLLLIAQAASGASGG
ncbi:DUF2182 domain-containing protein [Paraburkholderia susongensis]|uniref:Predicted metal-binding membrane protein n=1 Tax=Paraburkholderia susongensis TaxID=1515439 RepID=A0A1X7LK14_9BURK|nr:DUF2182 domain-containing protein [Paraburkholderia susongensis]SMG53834.1 Predicted metal-binding membrane protein [Paraburkholderia susongensis]